MVGKFRNEKILGTSGSTAPGPRAQGVPESSHSPPVITFSKSRNEDLFFALHFRKIDHFGSGAPEKKSWLRASESLKTALGRHNFFSYISFGNIGSQKKSIMYYASEFRPHPWKVKPSLWVPPQRLTSNPVFLWGMNRYFICY